MDENRANQEQEDSFSEASGPSEESEALAVNAQRELPAAEAANAEETQESSDRANIPQLDSASRNSDTESDFEVIPDEPSLPDLIPFHDTRTRNYFPDNYTSDVIRELSDLQLSGEDIQPVAPERTSPKESENNSPEYSDEQGSDGDVFSMSLESEESIHDSNAEGYNLVNQDIVVDSHESVSVGKLAPRNDDLGYFRDESKDDGNPNVSQKVTGTSDVITGVSPEKMTQEDIGKKSHKKGKQESFKPENANAGNVESKITEKEYHKTDELGDFKSPKKTVDSKIVGKINPQKTDELKDLKLEGSSEKKETLLKVSKIPTERIEGCIEKSVTEVVELFASSTKSISKIAKPPVKDDLLSDESSNKPGSSKVLTEAEYELTMPRGRRHYSDSSIEEAQEAYEALKPENLAKDNPDTDNLERSYECKPIETSNGSSDEFVDVFFDVKISKAHIAKVLKRMRSNHYMADGNEEDLKMYTYCKYLFEKDYKIKVINNEGGTLCKNYPARIIVPYVDNSSSSAPGGFDPRVYQELTLQSSGSRIRDRFVAPAIYYQGKYICRSATLTVKKSAVYETATKSPPPKEVEVDPGPAKRILKHVRTRSETFVHRTSTAAEAIFKLMDLESMRKHRDDDIKLLQYCNVLYISDLMVEYKKKKYWISVSSSEKIYQEAYSDFEILQMPYPGCKFFSRYHEAKRIPDGLLFDWNRSDVNAMLKIPSSPNITVPPKEWLLYKEWDVVELTQNYLELILNFFIQGSMSMLVHCISGWDRTPLFIALLRISLWADGLIHKSLNALEMAYLTLAYDWYLFGHNLPGRLKKGEEIMHFCYKFLEYFLDDYYSVTLTYNNAFQASRLDHCTPIFLPFLPGTRAQKIQELKNIVLELYDEHVMRIPR